MERKKTVLFYDSSLDDVKAQKFYQIDFDIIRKNGYNLIITDKKCDLFKWWKYDIIFIYFYTWGVFEAVVARFFLKKVYFTGGIDSLDRLTADKKSFVKQKIFFLFCYCLSTRCIIVSDNDWNNIIKEYNGWIKNKLVKSYHAIDLDRFISTGETRGNYFVTVCWQGTKENIIRKGVDKSIVIFKYLKTKPEFKDYRYYIVGKTGLGTSFIQNMIERYSLSGSVYITGEIDEEEKIKMMTKSKYFFQLSKYEGFGLAALEALASGNIIIHSNAGGLKYVVGDNGLIFNKEVTKESIDELYEKLISFDYKKVIESKTRIYNDYSFHKRMNEFNAIFKS